MRLHALIADLSDLRQMAGGNPEITGIATHSGRVKPGDLFVALRGDGSLEDRHPFVPQAVQNGAVAVVAEREVETGATARIRAGDTHRALAALARRFYDAPADRLRIVGATGTKGKTSTVYLIHALLNAAGFRPGLLGTVEHLVGNRRVASDNSTPQAHDLHRMFREMADAGTKAVVMEVTSHALAQHRVDGIAYQAAVFTNLTRDHLDYHASPEAYLAAKALLFDNLRTDAHAIVNADDPATGALLKRCRGHIVRYGRAATSDVRILSGHTDWRGTHIQFQTPAGPLDVELALLGDFQFYNAAAAIATGLAFDIPLQTIAEAMRGVRVPGRFEVIDCGQNFSVIVDYAHAPAPLEHVLKTARKLTSGRLICAFGCGGDRDRGKRPIMGDISAKLSNLTVVTSDNPRTEDPEAIIRDILPGVGKAPHIVETDRRKAIEIAIRQAGPGDLVLIAGKGHEDYQIIGRTKMHFDDREIAREILEASWKA